MSKPWQIDSLNRKHALDLLSLKITRTRLSNTSITHCHSMENHFRSLREDYQADISRSEQNRVNYEKEMTFLKERLSTKNTQVAEVMQRAAELHELHGALEAKDNQIAELQEKVRSSMRVGQMLQKAQQQAEEFAAFPQGAALNAAPTGALKPAVLDFISRYTKHAEELEKQVREANLKATQATDALKLQEPKLASLAHQLEEKHLKIKELEVKVASLEKCRKEEKKQSEDLAKSMEESQKDYADLHKKNEGLAEQIQLLKELLEVAETRANVADNNTRSQIEEIHILRAGNKIIQVKLKFKLSIAREVKHSNQIAESASLEQ